jgi:DNA end-binding protein Ku
MGSATLGFGLVSIPCKIYLAASAEAVSFNGITPSGHRVKQRTVDEVTGEEVERDALLKGYEHARGQFVTFTPDELKALEAAADKSITIEACVPLDDVDLVQAEKSYYLGPDKGGDKAYALLLATLEGAKRGAVAQWATRGREHLVLVRPHQGVLVMHTLYYSDEVRDQSEIAKAIPPLLASDRELSMARTLVEQMAGAFDPNAYRDRYRERVLAAAAAKVAGEEVVIPTAPVGPRVADLFEALRLSIANATVAVANEPARIQAAAPVEATAPVQAAAKGKGKAKGKSKAA